MEVAKTNDRLQEMAANCEAKTKEVTRLQDKIQDLSQKQDSKQVDVTLFDQVGPRLIRVGRKKIV